MLQTYHNGDKLIVCLNGELDHFCAQAVRRELDALIALPHVRHLILDFSSLTFMDSSGIGVILGRYKLLREKGGTVSVAGMNAHVARIFRMSGLDRIIRQIDNTREVAVR